MIVEQRDNETLCLTPEDADDIWALHEALRAGDVVRTSTVRKVAIEGNDGEVRDTHRVHVELAVRLADTDGLAIDLAAGAAVASSVGEGAGLLRVSGRVCEPNAHVRLGAHHTLDIVPGRPAVVSRPDGWLAEDARALRAAAARLRPGAVCVVAVDAQGAHAELGAAQLVFGGMEGSEGFRLVHVRTAAHVRAGARGAAKGSGAAERARERFVEDVAEAVAEKLPLGVASVVLVACTDATLGALVERKVLAHAAVGKDVRSRMAFLPISVSAMEALPATVGPSHLATLCAVAQGPERLAMEEFRRLQASGRTVFGPAQVRAASEMGAISTLLVSDAHYRSGDAVRRRAVAALGAACEAAGGRIVVFARGSPYCAELEKLTGIAALLHFPVPESGDCDASWE